MKIPLPGGGYLVSDDEPRNTPYHKRIVQTASIPGTETGTIILLECGHKALASGRAWGPRERMRGDLSVTGGVILCDMCLRMRHAHN